MAGRLSMDAMSPPRPEPPESDSGSSGLRIQGVAAVAAAVVAEQAALSEKEERLSQLGQALHQQEEQLTVRLDQQRRKIEQLQRDRHKLLIRQTEVSEEERSLGRWAEQLENAETALIGQR